MSNKLSFLFDYDVIKKTQRDSFLGPNYDIWLDKHTVP